MQESNDSKDQLFSIIAHDLRSSVYVLGINITTIMRLLEEKKYENALPVSRESGKLIGSTQSLLNNLLYWSLSETGQISFNAERIPADQLINQVCYDYLPMAAAKKIHLHFKMNVGVFCTVDINSMKIVLRNLIDNAIKYTPEGEIIFIAAWQSGGRCFISIQDTGVGIEEELLGNIRAGESRRTSRDTQGRRSAGIGLWLAKSMSQKNGGSLRMHSVDGIGTTITIELPAEAEPSL